MTVAKGQNAEVSDACSVDAAIRRLCDWRGATLAKVRALIKRADPNVIENVKWRKPSNNMQGVPVWEHDGLICTGETYKVTVKATFARGAALEEPYSLFNASLNGGTRRAIDFHEGEGLNELAFTDLISAAVELNQNVIKKRNTKQ